MADDRKRGLVRTIIAIVLLTGLGAIAVFALIDSWHPRGIELFVLCTAIISTLAAAVGVAAGQWWGRWLGLAHGVACTMYAGIAAVAVAGLGRLPSDVSLRLFLLALALAGPGLLGCLSGRTMFDRFDRRAGRPDGARAAFARWAAITNLSSMFVLLLLSMALLRDGLADGRASILGLVSTALVLAGVALLARGKTLGVLLAPLACLVQIALILTMKEGPRPVAAVLLAPGLIMALAATAAYSAPIWRFLRGR